MKHVRRQQANIEPVFFAYPTTPRSTRWSKAW